MDNFIANLQMKLDKTIELKDELLQLFEDIQEEYSAAYEWSSDYYDIERAYRQLKEWGGHWDDNCPVLSQMDLEDLKHD